MARLLSSLALPSSTLSALTRAGYETVNDLLRISPEALAEDLKVSLPESQAIFALAQESKPGNVLTQSAASLLTTPTKFPCGCAPVDKLLDGGLPRGHILEISGPPGSCKEKLAIRFVRSFLEAGEEVVFVDSQNMTSATTLDKALAGFPSVPANYRNLIGYTTILDLAELMIFMYNLSSYLDSSPKTSLLVFNSISFPFQRPSLSYSARIFLLEQIKKIFATVCTTKQLSIVTTSQLATKIFNADGSPGNVETGTTSLLLPQLGLSYLPSGRSYRILITQHSMTTGAVRMISSPTVRADQGPPLWPKESYTLDMPGGEMT